MHTLSPHNIAKSLGMTFISENQACFDTCQKLRQGASRSILESEKWFMVMVLEALSRGTIRLIAARPVIVEVSDKPYREYGWCDKNGCFYPVDSSCKIGTVFADRGKNTSYAVAYVELPVEVYPCPFCGTQFPGGLCISSFPIEKGSTEYGWHRVSCTKCVFDGPQAKSQEEAIALWNKRADFAFGSFLPKDHPANSPHAK